MLLSSAAEAMYWTGRYLERARALAWAVLAYERLSLDLPPTRSLGLRPLLSVMGSDGAHPERPANATPAAFDAEKVLHALALDDHNPSSVFGAVCRARENLRRGRVVSPPSVWTTLNALHLLLSGVDAQNMAGVLGALDEVVSAGSRIDGDLAAGMTRDAAYSFLRIGGHLERADMVVRTIDAVLSTMAPSGSAELFNDVRWIGLLQTVGAHSMYRRRHHTHVDLATVLEFLTVDVTFPRSLAFCLALVDDELAKLPHPAQARAAHATVGHAASSLAGASAVELPAQVSRVLWTFAALHTAIRSSYFPEDPAVEPRIVSAMVLATTPAGCHESPQVAAQDPATLSH
jgi:uncharacterized alpha-E superfamily protein